MSKVVVVMSMSLDGFVAAEDDGPGHGLGVGGEPLHAWLAAGKGGPRTFRPEGGVNAAVFDEMVATGAVITGRRTFELAGEWGGDHHDGVPIFVLTRRPPSPPVRGLVHYSADLAGVVEEAKASARDRDVMMHGASSARALLRAGLVDELAVTLVPILLGRGRRLFDDEDPVTGRLRLVGSREGLGVLHLRYAVESEPTRTPSAP